MARLRYNGLRSTLGATLTAGDSTITFAEPLTHNGGQQVPTLGAGDLIPLSLMGSSGLAEIVHLTSYTAGATTGSILRGQEGTAAAAHNSSSPVVHSPTVQDVEATGSSGGGGTLKGDWSAEDVPYEADSIVYHDGYVVSAVVETSQEPQILDDAPTEPVVDETAAGWSRLPMSGGGPITETAGSLSINSGSLVSNQLFNQWLGRTFTFTVDVQNGVGRTLYLGILLGDGPPAFVTESSDINAGFVGIRFSYNAHHYCLGGAALVPATRSGDSVVSGPRTVAVTFTDEGATFGIHADFGTYEHHTTGLTKPVGTTYRVGIGEYGGSGGQNVSGYVTSDGISTDWRILARRTPASHAATHASGGSDPVTPAAIGAAEAVGANDVEITDATKGVVLKSPDGTRYRITVANGGTLTTTAL